MGDLLVTDSVGGQIERWRNGVLLNIFGPGVSLPSPQQVNVLADNSVLVVAGIASPTVEGVYHFNSDGSLRRFIATEGLKGPFGEQVPRGAAVLGDGSYLITASDGVFKTTGTPPSGFVEIVGGVDAQYVVAMPPGAPQVHVRLE